LGKEESVKFSEKKKQTLAYIHNVEERILRIHGINVIIDSDLAELYDVSTKALNQAIKRNKERFPEDFIFQLSKDEKKELVTNCDHLGQLKYAPTLPYVFTEHGAIMAATVLKSDRAIKVSVYIVRAFVKLRKAALSYKELTGKLKTIEKKIGNHDKTIQSLIIAIRKLMNDPEPKKKRKIGF